jgi:lysophospholipase L1-like esterase
VLIPLAACSAGDDVSVTTVTPEGTLVVLGDSITYQANDAILELVPSAVVDAFPGRSMVVPFVSDTGLDRVPDLPLDDESHLVVALGTNDAGYDAHDAGQLQEELDTLLDAIGRERCITWVLPHVQAPRSRVEITRVEAFGARLRAEMSSLPCGAVLDWPAVVAEDPTLIGPDGVHPTPAGEAAFARLVASAA